MYRERFSIQKCILAIQLAEYLGKNSLNLSNTIYSNLYPHLSLPTKRKKKKINTPTFPLLWLLTIVKASILQFFFTLKNLFVIWKRFKVAQMRENANMIHQS